MKQTRKQRLNKCPEHQTDNVIVRQNGLMKTQPACVPLNVVNQEKLSVIDSLCCVAELTSHYSADSIATFCILPRHRYMRLSRGQRQTASCFRSV